MLIYLDDYIDGPEGSITCKNHFDFMHAVKDNEDILHECEFSFDFHLNEVNWDGYKCMIWLIDRANYRRIDLSGCKVWFHSRDMDKRVFMEKKWKELVTLKMNKT